MAAFVHRVRIILSGSTRRLHRWAPLRSPPPSVIETLPEAPTQRASGLLQRLKCSMPPASHVTGNPVGVQGLSLKIAPSLCAVPKASEQRAVIVPYVRLPNPPGVSITYTCAPYDARAHNVAATASSTASEVDAPKHRGALDVGSENEKEMPDKFIYGTHLVLK